MTRKNYDYMKQLIKEHYTIQNAMKIIDESNGKCLYVVDDNDRLLGSLSDGDIRRSILNGTSFKDSITDIFNRKAHYIFENEYNLKKIKKIMKENDLDSVPLVNKSKRVLDIINNQNTNEKSFSSYKPDLNLPVVIMAGGLGTRLDPITKIIPKPLIPLEDSTIIEKIIKRFLDVGCNSFYATVNYKSKIMKAYFDDVKKNYDLTFINETKPQGTAGSLQKLQGKMKTPFFVTNCDIIIKTDYHVLYEFHKENKYDLTLVAAAKTFTVPYGTCVLNDKGNLSHINEKPSYEFLTNTGLYILNPDLLELIPENKFFHITELIENIKNKGRNVGVFPVSEDSWIDTGQLKDYKKYIFKFS